MAPELLFVYMRPGTVDGLAKGTPAFIVFSLHFDLLFPLYAREAEGARAAVHLPAPRNRGRAGQGYVADGFYLNTALHKQVLAPKDWRGPSRKVHSAGQGQRRPCCRQCYWQPLRLGFKHSSDQAPTPPTHTQTPTLTPVPAHQSSPSHPMPCTHGQAPPRCLTA